MPRALRPAVLALIGLPLALAGLVLLGSPGPGTADLEEVVVYSARHYGQEKAFEEFTKRTGIRVKIFNGNTA